MSSEITLPVWLVALAGVFALWSVIDRMLVPSVRWVLRRRFNRAVERLNTRLQLRIQPFKLAKRRALIDQLIFDPEVLHAIEDYATTNGVPREVAQDKARRYAKEIVPSFSAYTYFGIGTRLSRRVSQFLYRVRLGYVDQAALQKVDPKAAVIFVMNHRSNMDYILVTYMAATTSALSYAVGEWARVWLLQNLIRGMGAYFVRRDSSEPLYRKVLSRYVHMATAAGVTQAVFPEGGLTRNGALQPAKLGLLSYMVSSFDPNGARDIVFVPVGVNYDRVLEDRVQLAALETKEKRPRFKFSLGVFMGFMLKSLWQQMTGRWLKYGYACVSFGTPISMKDYLRARTLDFRTLGPDARFAEIDTFGRLLMTCVGQVVPALPVPLAATALLEAGALGASGFELKGRVYELIRDLAAQGRHVHIPRAGQEAAVDMGLKMLTMRHLVIETDGVYRINPAEIALLRYYANSIAQLIVKPAAATSAGVATPSAFAMPPAGQRPAAAINV